ncbi:MAG: TrmH family RNA methyltransferase, partial [Anaerolineales bacterium]
QIDGGTDVFHPTAVRASMGAMFWKPVIKATLEEFSVWVKVQNMNVVGSSAKGTVDYREAEYTSPVVLMLGTEQKGLTDKALMICDQVVRLPMHGRATSLNLSVAAGILIYEIAARMQ